MANLLTKLKKTKGAVTIEATISLTAFLFLFIMIYSLITICRTQAIIQVAINSTAKELSQYSYLYSITGLHDSMKNVASSAEETKKNVNNVAVNVSQVFSGIQSIADTNVDFGDPASITAEWDACIEKLKDTEESATEAQKTITEMVKQDPQKLLFGMAQLMVSEGYEQAKSAVAEAVSRVLTQKHLKRSENDTAENFCRSVGILPGTYFGEESYFNGIDFSHSTLLPYKSSDITIVANYKMKLLQLLPVDYELHFTQTAVTIAWLQGDVDVPDTPEAVVEKIGDSLWTVPVGSERERLIRNLGVKDLKDDGFYSVSGNDYLHGYKSDPQTFAVIRSYNPLINLDSVAMINEQDLIDRLNKISAEVTATTDNIHSVKIKKPDANGNLLVSEVNCDGESKKKVILVIPEDEGLLKKMEAALESVDTDVEFEFLPGFGTFFETSNAEKKGG